MANHVEEIVTHVVTLGIALIMNILMICVFIWTMNTRSELNNVSATLAEMNARQKSVVVKQHEQITATLTEEIHKAVEAVLAGKK